MVQSCMPWHIKLVAATLLCNTGFHLNSKELTDWYMPWRYSTHRNIFYHWFPWPGAFSLTRPLLKWHWNPDSVRTLVRLIKKTKSPYLILVWVCIWYLAGEYMAQFNILKVPKYFSPSSKTIFFFPNLILIMYILFGVFSSFDGIGKNIV